MSTNSSMVSKQRRALRCPLIHNQSYHVTLSLSRDLLFLLNSVEIPAALRAASFPVLPCKFPPRFARHRVLSCPVAFRFKRGGGVRTVTVTSVSIADALSFSGWN